MESFMVSQRDIKNLRDFSAGRKVLSIDRVRKILRRIEDRLWEVSNAAMFHPNNLSYQSQRKELQSLRQLAKLVISFQEDLRDDEQNSWRKEFIRIGVQD